MTSDPIVVTTPTPITRKGSSGGGIFRTSAETTEPPTPYSTPIAMVPTPHEAMFSSVQRRESALESSADEWSDPGDIPAMTSPNGGETVHGIEIPAVLQPLFGLDFVPYLPVAVVTNASEVLEEVMDSTDEDCEDEGDMFLEKHELEKKPKFGGLQRKFRKAIGKRIKAMKKKQRAQTGRRLVYNDHMSSFSSMSDNFSAFDTQPSSFDEVPDVLEEHIQNLVSLEHDAEAVRLRAAEIEQRVFKLKKVAMELQEALRHNMHQLANESQQLELTKQEMQVVEERIMQVTGSMEKSLHELRDDSTHGNHVHSPKQRAHFRKRSKDTDDLPNRHAASNHRARSSTEDDAFFRTRTRLVSHAPPRRPSVDVRRKISDADSMKTTASTSFMRVEDLDIESTHSSHSSVEVPDSFPDNKLSPDHLFFIDENVPLVLQRLAKLAIEVSTDESERFTPTWETQRLLKNSCACLVEEPIPHWPYHPWYVAKGSEVMLWTGGVPHKGHGHDWPVVKARGVVKAKPRELLDFLLDSSQLKLYNKMSQGREEVVILQEGVGTKAEDSQYGMAGDARILRALNKPKLLPRTIEMLSLWYTAPVPDAPDSFMIVSRSVWENDGGNASRGSNVIRSEMLLGVQMLRPCPEGCELTTITHVFSPGVPEMMAKRAAPGNAATMIREIQGCFPRTHAV